MGIIGRKWGQRRVHHGLRTWLLSYENPAELDEMEPFEIIPVETTTVACDGGDGPLGHPRVYLTLSKDGEIECPYCSRKYVLKEGAQVASH
jgi:uncharacterized Zn-finger protein